MSRRHRLLPLAFLTLTLGLAACAESPDELARYGALHQERGDHVQAIETYTELLELRPGDVDSRIERGRAYKATRQWTKARRDFEQAIVERPDDVDLRFLLVETYEGKGELDEALTQLDALDEAAPVRSSRFRGRLLRERGLAQVRALLKEVDERVPEDRDEFWRAMTRLDFDRAQAYLAQERHGGALDGLANQVTAAAEDLGRARGSFQMAARGTGDEALHAVCDLATLDFLDAGPDRAAARLEMLLESELPTDVEIKARGLLAEAYEVQGDPDAAARHMSAAVDLDPDDLDLRFSRGILLLKQGKLAEAQPDVDLIAADEFRGTQTALLEGMLRLQQGDAHGAVAEFQFVAANAGGSPLSHLWHGLALASSGRQNAPALSAFARALELDPRFYMAHLARAGSAMDEGWWDVAVEHGRRCVQLEPDRPSGWLALGEALIRRGANAEEASQRETDFDMGAEALGRAFELDPTGFSGQEAIAMRSVVTGRLSEGIDRLREALGDKQQPDLLVGLARMLFVDQSDAEALECLRAAVGADATHARATRMLAEALMVRDDTTGAEQVLRTHVQATPDSAEAALMLARFLARHGRLDEAGSVLDAAAQRVPDSRELHVGRYEFAWATGDVAASLAAARDGLKAAPAVRAFHQAGPLAAALGELELAAQLLHESTARFPTDAALRAAQALVAARTGEAESARVAARKAVEHAPQSMQTLAAVGVAVAELGDLETARALILDARSLAPVAREVAGRHLELAADPAVAKRLADIHMLSLAAGPVAPANGTSRLEDALVDVLAGPGAGDVILLDLLADTQLARNAGDEAVRNYRLLLEVEPRLHTAQEKIARVLAADGRRDEALVEIEHLIEAGHGGARLHAFAGALLDDAGQVERAREHYLRSVRLDAGDPEILVRLGHVHERAGAAEDAVDVYERALTLDPSHPVANARLGELIATTEPDRAERITRRAVSLAPRTAYARCALGMVLSRMDRMPEAVVEFRKATEVAPGDPRSWALLGSALVAESRVDEANTALLRAVELDPSRTDSHYLLGTLAEREGHMDAAVAAYRRALTTSPDHWPSLNNLAWRLTESKGDLAEAVELAERAVRLSERSPVALDTLGWAQLALGRKSEAVRSLRAAVSGAPGDPAIRWRLVQALHANGDLADCRAELARVLASPDFADVEAARAFERNLE